MVSPSHRCPQPSAMQTPVQASQRQEKKSNLQLRVHTNELPRPVVYPNASRPLPGRVTQDSTTVVPVSTRITAATVTYGGHVLPGQR